MLNDSIAAWMIAGGPRDVEHGPRTSHHLIAIRAARRAARAERPSVLDRVRARFAMPVATPAVDCCVA